MSTLPQHGRRRAKPVRKDSLARLLWDAAPKPGAPAARMTAVAVAGALLAGAGIAHAATSATTAGPQAAGSNVSAAVTAPGKATVNFATIAVKTVAENTTNVPAVTGAANDVKPLGAGAGPVDDPVGAQKYAASKLGDFGWGQDQMSCLVQLWNRESDWQTTAENPSSLAYGIAQSLPASKMDSVGSDWRTNYRTQIDWGLGYVKDRYGSPCGAWDHETSIGWY
ncbi:transglycosylase [Specibacter cremeus]|uniref:aggregation-promoting factor C-terminal-like domain-containing protein n=1 Tax=Specibacter cremeus TaxID=1629051 RepID=UPI000F7AE6E3|nr:transglycosylase [Specibacter cremeus]